MAQIPQGDAFPLTRHSLISAAQGKDPGLRDEAINSLANAYWRPVYKYVRLRWRLDPEDARDFTQDFFARLIEKEFLASYDPTKGRLRTFLRTCVDRMAMNRSRDARREKRGGGAVHVSLDFQEAEHELAAAGGAEWFEDFFEKEWVRTLFALAVERLRVHCRQAGKAVHFQMFELCDLAESDLAESEGKPSYADLAQRFGVAMTDVTNYLAFARREFRRSVLEQLREMTGSEEEFRREAQVLLGVEPK